MAWWKKLLPKSKFRFSGPSAACDEPAETCADQERPTDSTGPPTRVELESADIGKYYYPNMDKDSATDALRRKPVGTFLLRPSQLTWAEYTLSVRTETHVYNVRIYKNTDEDGSYYLDGPSHSRKYFPTISALLNHYTLESRELVALSKEEEEDEEKRTHFRLLFPLSHLECTGASVDSSSREQCDDGIERRVRSDKKNSGSLKLMRQFL